MATFELHEDARADLAEIAQENPDLRDDFLAVFEEIEADPDNIDWLLQHGFGASRDEEYGVKKWLLLWRHRGLWRLRVHALEDAGHDYRIIYAYYIPTRSFWVLAIRHHREVFDAYDNADHPLTKRVIAAYDGLE